MILHRIYLNNNCEFKIEQLKVLINTKHGKYLGRDDDGKLLYEKLPARIWQTSKGKVDTELFDKIKQEKDGYSIMTKSDNFEFYKRMLKKELINSFQCVLDTLEHRKRTAMDKALESHIAYSKANSALEKAKEIII